MPNRKSRRAQERRTAKAPSRSSTPTRPDDDEWNGRTSRRMEQLFTTIGSDGVLEALNEQAIKVGEYAGIAWCDPGCAIVFAEPKPRYAHLFEERKVDDHIRAAWSHQRLIGHRYVFTTFRRKETPDKTEGYLCVPVAMRLEMLLASLAARGHQRAQPEVVAQRRLLQYLNPRQIESYVLSGAFIERGPRSNVAYVFRRGLPIIALRAEDGDEECHPLATLCIHPLGYFDETNAGVMPPSDEVLALLLMLRADEVMLWRKCEQHALQDPRSMV